MTGGYSCNGRVCGLQQEEKPWSGERNQIPSFRICPCCGVEAGVGDEGIWNVVDRRREWLEGGLEWFNPSERPENWDVDHQLSQIPPDYRFSRLIETEQEFRQLYNNGGVELLRRARIESSVWISVLEDDFERFGPLAAEANSLSTPVESVLLESDNEDVFRRLRQRSDLDLRPKAKQRIEEVLD